MSFSKKYYRISEAYHFLKHTIFLKNTIFLLLEQGEDMQGYVTELILTLEAVVETLDSGKR